MQLPLLIGVALVMAATCAANAQTADGAAPAPSAPEAAPSGAAAPPALPTAPTTGAGLKQGMMVKDNSGAPVGPIDRVGQTADGSPAVMVNVDGKDVGLLASNLTVDPTGSFATTNLSKAQLAAPATPSTSSAGGAARPPG